MSKNQKFKILSLIFIIVLSFIINYKPYAATANIQLETGLPNIPPAGLTTGNELPEYINYLYLFGLGLIALLALVQMMIGGLTYIFAAGNVAKFEVAKDTIKQALLGLGLLLTSYLLLRTINPDLVNLKNPSINPINIHFQETIDISGEGADSYAWREISSSAPDTHCSRFFPPGGALTTHWINVYEGFCTPPKPTPTNGGTVVCCGLFLP